MNLLITGGCGFIGSNFINYYYNKYRNVNIINIDAMYYCASIENIDKDIRESDRYTFVKGNINDYKLLCDIFDKYKITHVIHFAAQSHVDNSFNDSLQYTYDNVKGTHTLLEAIKNAENFNNIMLLHFSTDEVYGESGLTDDEKTEESILCPTNPYAASKAAAEMYVRSYIYSFGLKAIITRGNNVYGLNQYPEKLIPKFIKLIMEGNKCTIHGKGDSIRNFIHVYDVCTAVDRIIKIGTFGEVYNIGSDHSNEKSVLDVTKILIKKINKSDNIEDYIEYVSDRPFNDKRYFISNDKLKELDWEQTITFDVGIDELIEDYNNNNSVGIILYRKVTDRESNKLWNKIYNTIRNISNINIVIVCNSDEDYVKNFNKLTNCTIIKSELDYDNKLIPYYYYYKNRYFSKAAIIYDNMDPNKCNDIISKLIDNNLLFDELIIVDKKPYNINVNEQNVIKKIDKSLLSLYNNPNWNGCKDMLLILTHSLLVSVASKYNIFNRFKGSNYKYNCMLENIISFLLINTNV